MSDREKLIQRVEFFYTDIMEGYKEVELQLRRESTVFKMFKKVNYEERAAAFRACKKKALHMETKDIQVDKGDEESRELKTCLERCLAMFNSLCDSHITMQEFLKKKATPGSGVKMSDYKKIMDLVRSRNMAVQQALHALDVVYADYIDEADDDFDEADDFDEYEDDDGDERQ